MSEPTPFDAVILAGGKGGGSLGGSAVTSLLIEQAVPFTRELAVLLARSPRGEIAVWPVVETVQADGIYSEVLAPAPGLDAAAAAAVRASSEAWLVRSSESFIVAVVVSRNRATAL